MKNSFSVAVVTVAVLLGLSARGVDISAPKDLGITNRLPANATQTANVGTYLDLRTWESLSLRLKFNGVATNLGDAVLTFVRTLDNPGSPTAVWETTPKFTWTVPIDGTTNSIVAVTNLPRDLLSAIAGVKLFSIQNTTASTNNNLTNVVLEGVGKRVE